MTVEYSEVWSPNKYDDDGGFIKSIIVIHTSEPGPYYYGKNPGTAENLGNYLSQDRVEASYQLAVDREGGVCRMVTDEDRAWAAGTVGNNEGLHICFLGWSAQSRDEWMEYKLQLDTGIEYIAQWCRKYQIDPIYVNAEELRNQKPGICGHGDVAQAWSETNHTDPGAEFPFDYIIQGVFDTLKGGNDMSEESEVVEQFMGPHRDGWPELAPEPGPDGKRFSIFRHKSGRPAEVDKQTLVEAIATLVFEATLRILPYRGKSIPAHAETVLGHAAIASGVGLDNQDLLIQLGYAHQEMREQLKMQRHAGLDAALYARLPQAEQEG